MEVVELKIGEGTCVPFHQSLHSLSDNSFVINGKPANIVKVDEQLLVTSSALQFPSDSYVPFILRTVTVTTGQRLILTISADVLLCIFNETGQMRLFTGRIGDLVDSAPASGGDKWPEIFRKDCDNAVTALTCLTDSKAASSQRHIIIACKQNRLLSLRGTVTKTRVTLLAKDLNITKMQSMDSKRPLNDEITYLLPMKISNRFISLHASGLLQLWDANDMSKSITSRLDLPYMHTCGVVSSSDKYVIVAQDGGQIIIYELSQQGTFDRLAQINAHAGCISALDIEERGNTILLASASEDHVVSLWELVSTPAQRSLDIKLIRSDYRPNMLPTGIALKYSKLDDMKDGVSLFITGVK